LSVIRFAVVALQRVYTPQYEHFQPTNKIASVFRTMSLNSLVENSVESPELKVNLEGPADGYRVEMQHIDAIHGQPTACSYKEVLPTTTLNTARRTP
jgi:hypothetical protein